MSLIKRARAALSAFTNPAPATKFYGTLNGIYDTLYGGGGVSGRNRDITLTEQGAATAFGLNTGLQRSIKFKQDALQMLEGGIYDGKTDELLISLNDRTLDMSLPGATFIAAMRTYARRHYHDFIGSIIFSNNLYGETYVKRLTNKLQDPRFEAGGVRWLNPLWVTPFEQDGRIAYYQYYAPNMASGDERRIEPYEMAFNIYHPNPHDDLRGMPPVLSALDSVNIERNEKRAVQAYFRNGMNPGGAMSPKGENTHLHDAEIQKMQTRFQQIYGGVDNMFRWLITPTEFAYQAFDQPDLQKNWTIIKEARLEVMMAIGVPVELAGDPSGTKYENADKVMQNWLRVNGKAEATGIAGYITDGLLRYFEPTADVYFGFDFTPFERQEAALTQSDFTSGIIPINIAQAERGYDVDETLKDVYLIGGKPMHRDTLAREARGVDEAPGKIVTNQYGVAVPQGDVFQYHIENGAVDVNEVRAGMGLPPKAGEAQKDDRLQQLQAQFTTMQAAVAAQIPPAVAAQMVGIVLPPGTFQQTPIGYTGNQMTIPGQVQPPAQLPAPDPTKDTTPVNVHLSLADDPYLVAQQERLKPMLPGVQWSDQSAFHVTVLHLPAATDEQLADLVETAKAYGNPDLSLRIGGLADFNTAPGQYAYHFRVGSNADLIQLHNDLCDVCEGMGMGLSPFSRDAYKPHITLGHGTEHLKVKPFRGMTVHPTKLVISRTVNGKHEIVWASGEDVEAEATTEEPETAKAVTIDFTVSDGGFKADIQHGDHTHEMDVIPWEWTREKARAELKAWRNFSDRQKTKRPFEFEYLRGKYADELTVLVTAGKTTGETFKSMDALIGQPGIEWMLPAFETALHALAADDHDTAIKSIDSIRGEFEDRFGAVVADMQNGDLSSRQRAGNIIRQLLRMFGARAYRQGLEDAGRDSGEVDEDEQAEINRLLSDQSSFVSGLTAAMITEGISPAQADGKAQMWFNGGISPFYAAGIQAGNSNLMLEFVLGGAEQHCEDCPRLAKQVHPAKQWKKRNLDGIPRVGQATECGGWKCQCKLVPTTAKASGSW